MGVRGWREVEIYIVRKMEMRGKVWEGQRNAKGSRVSTKKNNNNTRFLWFSGWLLLFVEAKGGETQRLMMARTQIWFISIFLLLLFLVLIEKWCYRKIF